MKAKIRGELININEAYDIAMAMTQTAETFATVYDLAVIFHILKEKFYLTDELLGELFKEFRKLQDENFLIHVEDKTELEELDYLLNYIKNNFKIDLQKDGYICSDDGENDEEDSDTKYVTYDIGNSK